MGSASHSAFVKDSRSLPVFLPAEPSGEHRSMERDDAAIERQERQYGGQVTVADECFARPPRLSNSEQRSY